MIRLALLIALIAIIPVISIFLATMPRKDSNQAADQKNAASTVAPASDQPISEIIEVTSAKTGEDITKCHKNHIRNLETYVDNREVSVEKILIPEKDEQPPEITLNGPEKQTIVIGSNYEEQGATAVDNCDEVIVETIGEVNTKVAGTYTITYRSTDKSGNTAEKTRLVRVANPAAGDGVIYLTFDDGPGDYTNTLLDILKKYGIKATFFVTGAGDDALIAREHNEGHAIGLHTSSHNYSYIYSSIDNFLNDLYRVQDRVKNITGETTTLMRFPGGSSNLVSKRYDGGSHIMSQLVGEVTNRGFTYFDWNILSGDAGETTDPDQVYINVISHLKPSGASVVLQHDVKDYSVAAVERIIQYGLDNGYAFAKLDAGSFTAHHGVNN